MFFILFFLIGCKNTEGNDIETILFPAPVTSAFKLSGLIEKQQLIKLETTNESLLGAINKVVISDSLIFIKSNGAIYVFSPIGKFVRKIDKEGLGPNEYTGLSDFDVDRENKQLIIFDKGKKQILYYDFSGHYIKSTSLDFWAIKLLNISSNQLLLFSGNESSGNEQSFKFTLLTEQGSKQHFHVIDKNKSGYLHVNAHQNFYHNPSGYFFFEIFNDTVYSIDKDLRTHPKYFFSFANKNIPYSFFERPYSNIMEFFQAYKKTDYAYGISLFMETARHIFTVYYAGGKPSYAVYNKKNKEAYSYREIQDDLSLDNVTLPPFDEDFRLWTAGNDFIYFLGAEWLADKTHQIQSTQLKEFASQLNINDNPVMVIATVK